MKDISLPGKPTIVCLVLVLALLSSGCAMKAYEGPELPRSEIAVLDAMHQHGGVLQIDPGIWPIPLFFVPNYKHQTFIIEIDGNERNVGREIHVLPGQHTVRVHYFRRPDVTLIGIPNYETRDLSIDFTAEAGHEYRIPAERRGERNWIWVEDTATGKVVAGEKPPDVKAKEKEPAAPPEEP
ncbi:MAG: hypothetical protein V3S59_05140 [Alphaproteobacteria bacterium]